jgi:chromosome partitioning protein
MRRIVVASQKGGVGKTTSATALAVGLARAGLTTLLIDCDGQANSSWTMLSGQGAEPPTLSAVLLRQAEVDEAVRPTRVPGLDLLPSDSSLNAVNVALVNELSRDTRLRSAMKPHEGRWDAVVLDTGPTLNTILANALVFGHEVIVPCDAGVYAMLGLVELERTIHDVREAYGNALLHLAGLLLTRTSRSNVVRDVEAELRTRFPGLVYDATIPASTKVEEAATRALTVVEHAPKSPAALAYEAFVSEVLSDGGEENGRGASSGQRARKGHAA